MSKNNITNYSDDELSLYVFNDEYLYNLRYNIDILKSVLDENFIYNEDQYNTLLNDIEDDEKENN